VHHFRFLQTSFSASNSHFETNFGYFSTYGAEIPKIGFLKGSRRLPFKKPIFIMRIAALVQSILLKIFIHQILSKRTSKFFKKGCFATLFKKFTGSGLLKICQ